MNCGNLMKVFRQLEGLEDLRFTYDGERLNPTKSIGEYDMQNGGEIDAFRSETAGKPVIYLFSPSEIDASVTLSLVPDWRFSAVYPVVPIKSLYPELGEQIQWQVRVHKDGSLTEIDTGLEMTYLFWEAQ